MIINPYKIKGKGTLVVILLLLCVVLKPIHCSFVLPTDTGLFFVTHRYGGILFVTHMNCDDRNDTHFSK